MALQYLLLGHLLGDFLFQTDRIASNKAAQVKWNITHVVLVTLCMMFFAIPLGDAAILPVLINGVLHFIIDWYKPRLAKRLRISELAGFLIDQAIHVLLLFIISFFSKEAAAPFLFPAAIWQMILVAVLVTSFGAIFNQYVLNALFPRNGQGFFAKNEKHLGKMVRFVMLLSLFLAWQKSLLFLCLLMLAIALAWLYFKARWSGWMSARQIQVKLLLDFGMACAGLFLLHILVPVL